MKNENHNFNINRNVNTKPKIIPNSIVWFRSNVETPFLRSMAQTNRHLDTLLLYKDRLYNVDLK